MIMCILLLCMKRLNNSGSKDRRNGLFYAEHFFSRVKSIAYCANNRTRIENSIKIKTTFERVSKIYLLNH